MDDNRRNPRDIPADDDSLTPLVVALVCLALGVAFCLIARAMGWAY